MSFVKLPPETEPVPAVRIDETKRNLLKAKVAALVAPALPLPESATIDVFDLAVAVRTGLPAGLYAGDFDGHDVEAILSEILTDREV